MSHFKYIILKILSTYADNSKNALKHAVSECKITTKMWPKNLSNHNVYLYGILEGLTCLFTYTKIKCACLTWYRVVWCCRVIQSSTIDRRVANRIGNIQYPLIVQAVAIRVPFILISEKFAYSGLKKKWLCLFLKNFFLFSVYFWKTR